MYIWILTGKFLHMMAGKIKNQTLQATDVRFNGRLPDFGKIIFAQRLSNGSVRQQIGSVQKVILGLSRMEMNVVQVQKEQIQ